MEAVFGAALLVALGMTIVAGIVRGFTGFGAAMLLLPVFAILYDAPQAVATVAGLGFLATLQLLPGVAREVAWREILPIVAAGALALPLGAEVLLTLDTDLMRRGISGLVLLMVLVLISGWRYPVRPGLWGSVAIGFLSGTLNGSTGVGGPPVVLYMLSGPNSAETNRANLTVFYTFINGGTFLSLFLHGVVDTDTVWRVGLLWPVQIASLWGGAYLFRRSSDAIYRRIAMTLLLAVALLGLFYR